MALIAGMLLAVFGRVLGRRAVLPALAGIAVYAVVVGGDATVVRAAVMGGLVVVATGLQRRSTGLVSLAVAVWLMALANPSVVWDVGLQLSAAATVGLILFAAKLEQWLTARWPSLQGGALTGTATPRSGGGGPGSVLRGVVVDGGVSTVAATVLTLPLVAYHFQRVSVAGLLANLLIVPAQPLILTSGTAGVAFGVAGVPWLPQGLLWVAWLGLWWTECVVTWVAALPGASWATPSFGLPALAATYAVIALVAARDRLPRLSTGRAASHAGRGAAWLTGAPALLALGVLAGLSVLAAAALPDGKLHVVFLDVGQGDAIFIQTPGGRQVLVDGGERASVLVNELGAVMPFWDRRLDLAALTHADADHMDAQIELPRRLALDGALATAATLESADAAAWRDALHVGGVTPVALAAGAWVALGDGVTLRVLNPDPAGYVGPDPDNENSLVLRVEYGAFQALLTGDAGLPSEAAWLGAGAPLAATVLKVGHHGSKTSTGPSFVAAVQPQLAVIQVGAENRYGHPTAETLANLAATTVLRTDLDGRIEVVSDGRRMWVRTGK